MLALFAWVCLGSGGSALAQAQDGASPTLPEPASLLILIRSTLIALNQANLTGNYSVLTDLGSASFKTDNPPEKLAATFAAFHEQKVDFSAVALATPRLSSPPLIDPKARLRIEGVFPTAPMQVNFLLLFEANQGRWQLAGINVNLAEAQQNAAQSPDSAPAKDAAPGDDAAAPPTPPKKATAKKKKATNQSG